MNSDIHKCAEVDYISYRSLQDHSFRQILHIQNVGTEYGLRHIRTGIAARAGHFRNHITQGGFTNPEGLCCLFIIIDKDHGLPLLHILQREMTEIHQLCCRFIAFRMNSGIIQRVASVPDPEEAFAMIRRVLPGSLGMPENGTTPFGFYLTPRLFNKIGIDPDNLRWLRMADGIEVGGGGLFATTEDNFRLMKLYADGGVWEGERILAEDYVKLATTNQNDSATESKNNPEASDNFLGYGFQIWMCKPKGAYRADGAMGQFTIVLPEQDMIIAITETAVGAHWAQSTLDITWDFVEKIAVHGALPENPGAYDALQRKLARLNIGNPPCQPYSPKVPEIGGKTFVMDSGHFTPFTGNFMTGEGPDDIVRFAFDFDVYGFVWRFETASGRKEAVRVATGGTRFQNILGKPSDCTQLYLCDAYWPEENVLEMHCRWLETCLQDTYRLRFGKDGKVEIEASNNSPFLFGKVEPITAHME